MKKLKALVIFSLILLTTMPAFCQLDPAEPEEKWKVIRFHKVNHDAAWFDFRKGGYGLAHLSPAKVIGIRKVEGDGFRFIPAMQAPDGIPQEAFDKFYSLSPLVKEMFIPYSEMKSVKFYYGITIRTMDGRKYHFRCKHPKQVAREIRSHLSNP